MVARWYNFKPKNPNLGQFLRLLQWKRLVYFMAIRSILGTFGRGNCHSVYLLVIWYIFPRFGKYYREKSGNPELD
jgi:hypothetical protein